MKCIICKSQLDVVFTAQVLHKYTAEYRHCRACGFLCVLEPHWLEEAYTSAIASSDTGLVNRNILLTKQLATVLYLVLGERGENRYIDAAGGYGMLTRLMRDIGFDFYWSDKYCKNLLSPGFEYDQKMGSCRAATAIEVLEHLSNPIEFIEEIFKVYGIGSLFFTTELYFGDPPKPQEWDYYVLSSGQHISFYQYRTLQLISKRLSLHLTSANGLHVFSKTPLNKSLYALTTYPVFSLIMHQLIRKRMRSKTMADHYHILKNNQQ